MCLVERQYSVIQHVCRCDGRLRCIQLAVRHLGVGIDIGLLVDTANALQGADVEGILGTQITRMGSLDFATDLVIQLFPFQRLYLRLSQNQAFFGNLGLQRPETGLEVGQVVP